MIDLSSEPKDDESDLNEARPPRHDLVPASLGSTGTTQPKWPFTHEQAEAVIQFLSRWAGPAVLIAAVVAIARLLTG